MNKLYVPGVGFEIYMNSYYSKNSYIGDHIMNLYKKRMAMYEFIPFLPMNSYNLALRVHSTSWEGTAQALKHIVQAANSNA